MLAWILLLLSTATVLGFQSGAPEAACVTFTPRHPGSETQPLPAPYVVYPAVPRVAQGNTLRLMLSSPEGLQFEGFVLQARKETGSREPLGRFIGVPQSAQAVGCSGGAENTITQISKSKKSSLEFEWQAPTNYTGTIVFNGTMLQDFATYWVGVQSEPVQVVKRSAGDNTGQSAGISTTRRPVTITSPPTLAPEVAISNRRPSDPLTDGCGSTKTCFGIPDDCVDAGTCMAVVACLVEGESYQFEMRAKDATYVAVGLSNDKNMGSDTVVECAVLGSDVHAYASRNDGRKNVKLPGLVENYGVKYLGGTYEDGNVYCKYIHNPIVNVNGTSIDLIHNKYNLLIAAGQAKALPDGTADIGYHFSMRGATNEPVNLAEVGTLGGASKLLLRLHAAFMISAWIGAASIGILLARYFKQTWVGSQLCGKDQWFAWHRMFMILTWGLTIAGFVLIFVELGAWSSADNPHAILGVVTTALAFIQPFMAALRPAPSSSRRPLFNWLHWLVGNAAHIFAIVTIFFATRLTKAEVPMWLDWVLVSYVAFHVIMHLIFSMVGCASEKNSDIRVNTFPMKDMNSSRSALQAADRNLDAPHGGLRKGLLAMYLVVILLLTIAIVVIVVLAPIEDKVKSLKKIFTSV